MREILFRGKVTQDKWVYGFYENVKLEEATIHYVDGKIVIPETVGQFTGLTDKNGKKIFEGDIVQIKDFTHGCALNYEQPTSNWVVHWREDMARFCIDYMSYFPFDFTKSEVIGNVHDNKELLGE